MSIGYNNIEHNLLCRKLLGIWEGNLWDHTQWKWVNLLIDLHQWNVFSHCKQTLFVCNTVKSVNSALIV
jgi:hypothetical protein